jgi:hypothetical protein
MRDFAVQVPGNISSRAAAAQKWRFLLVTFTLLACARRLTAQKINQAKSLQEAAGLFGTDLAQ